MSWALNSAFLQEVKDCNLDFWNTIRELKSICSGSSVGEGASQLVAFLGRLREQLAVQFGLEETYGYLQTSRVQSQHRSDQIELALAQHRTIFLHVSELAERAEQAEFQGKLSILMSSLFDDLRMLVNQVDEHERLESELVSLR